MKNSTLSDHADQTALITRTARFLGVPVTPTERAGYRWLFGAIIGVHATLGLLWLIMP